MSQPKDTNTAQDRDRAQSRRYKSRTETQRKTKTEHNHDITTKEQRPSTRQKQITTMTSEPKDKDTAHDICPKVPIYCPNALSH